MAVPKKKTSPHRQGLRRSHHYLRPTQSQTCPSCYDVLVSHQACNTCGHYKGRISSNKAERNQRRAERKQQSSTE